MARTSDVSTSSAREGYSRPFRPARFGLAVILAFVAVIALWSALAPLSDAAIAEGSLQVQGRPQSVQHPYGGVVEEILVDDGERVTEGEVLIRLSDTEPRAELDVLQAQRAGLVARSARLAAERDGLDKPRYPPGFVDAGPAAAEAAASEQAILTARNREHQSAVVIVERRIEQLRETITGATAEAESLERQAELIDEELQAARKLLEQGYTPRPRVLGLEREASQLGSALAAKRSEIAAARQSIAESEAEIARLNRARLAEIARELRETQVELAALGPKIAAAEEVLQRTEIVAPATGQVVALSVFTEGGVIEQGAPLMEIVPSSAPFFVDARLRLTELHGVEPGQEATIELLAVPREERPDLTGEVRTVSATRLVDERSGEGYYALQVDISSEDVRSSGLQLQAGMPVQVVMPTEPRTLIEYLINPLLDEVSTAFREH